MLDTKTKITFNNPKNEIVEYAGAKISVKPFLAKADQDLFIEIYLSEYFKNSKSRVINAEYALIISVLEICTDIKIVDEKPAGTSEENPTPVAVVTIDNILSSPDLINGIKNRIKNYNEFRALLHKTVEEEKESIRLNDSLSNSLKLIYAKLSNFIDDLTDSDFSPEKMKNVKEMLDTINSSPLLKDAVDIFKNNKQ